jgi:putative SOS response-associated peptidase YedK
MYNNGMCGRFTLRTAPAELVEIFRLLREPELAPRYNIAPTQKVAVVRPAEGAARELTLMHWGLIPSWSKDPKMGARLINARGETVADKPSFRSAFKRRRCLIPADGFYEWAQTDGNTKQPLLIGLKNGSPFAFAGLWEHWEGEGRPVESCTIITTHANELLRPIHDRMPVILPEERYDAWLDSDNDGRERLQEFLVPFPADELAFVAVSTAVNNPRNDSPDCVKPLPHVDSLFPQP